MTATGRRSYSAAEAAFLRRLGAHVAAERRRRGLYQEQLALAAGTSRNFLSLIECGTSSCDVLRVLRLAAALGVPAAALLEAAERRDAADPAGLPP
jgi:transcriptional regulator with XRE-family HTH domain